MVRKIVELHGGTITACGQPDAGAVFTLEMQARPALEAAADSAEPEQAALA